MKIITSFTLNWDLDVVDEQFIEYEGPVALAKGGGVEGAGEDLQSLYRAQADQAHMLTGVARDTVLPAYTRFLQESEGMGSQANQEKEATRAAADSQAASGAARAGLEQNLTSLGINPADSRYAHSMAAMGTQASAQQAAATTGARERTRQVGLAQQGDAVSLGMGTPTQAAAAAASAMNGASSLNNSYAQNRARDAQGIGSAVRGGMDLYGYLNPPGAADGGLIHMKDGGYVSHYAMGGVVRMGLNTPPPAPPPMPQQQPAGPGAAGYAGMAIKAAPMVGKGIAGVGKMVGSEGMQSFGNTLAKPGDMMYNAAQKAIDSVLPKISGMQTASQGTYDALTADQVLAGTQGVAEGEAGAAAGGAEAAGGAAGGAGAEAVGGGALETLGELATTALAAAADGGEIAGPGGPKDDMIPAMLSDGEFVMPIGTVKKYGLHKLEKMRQEGLQFEQELGIRPRARPNMNPPKGSARYGDGGAVDDESWTDGAKRTFQNMEDAMNPYRHVVHRYQNATEDQPGRTLQRASTPERGYIPRNASGGIDEEALNREQHRYQQSRQGIRR